jgi:beta-lactamase superfamily II metal-dependent hydrolase
VLSVALVLELGEQRVLLGGDVLKGARSPKSGWKGILRLLRKHGRERLFADLAAVKVAHHGSEGAFEQAAWAVHGSPAALIAPFTRSHLPDRATLANLKPFARELLVTSSHGTMRGLALQAGWSVSTHKRLGASSAPVVALRIHPTDGVTEVTIGPKAEAFQ